MRHSFVLALLVVACEVPPPGTDGGALDAATTSAPLPPEPPEAPRFACPPGWRTATLVDATICEPFSTDRAPTCGPLEIARVGGTSDCEAALPCPAGAWPDDAPSGAAFVLAGSTAGDGSRDRPWATIAEGLAHAGAGGTVVVGAGTYAEVVQLNATQTILGVCPERVTLIDPAATPQAPLVVRTGARPTIRGLRLSGAAHGLWLLADATLDARGLVLEAPQPLRLDAGATIVASDLRMSAAAGRAVVFARAHTSVSIARSHLEGGFASLQTAIALDGSGDGDSTLALSDSALLSTTDVAVRGGWSGTIERVAIEDVATGMVVLPGHEMSFTDVRARAITGDAGFLGVGGTGHLLRVTVSALPSRSAPAAAIAVFGAADAPGVLDGSDVVVAHGVNAGLALGGPSTVTLDRVVLLDVVGGVQALAEAAAVLHDVRIATAPTPRDADRSGNAVEVEGATLDLSRASLATGYAQSGVAVGAPGAMTLRDVAITGGLGLEALCRSGTCDVTAPTLTVERVHVAATAEVGLAVLGVGVDATDVDVDGVAFGGESTPAFGLVVGESGRLVGTRVRVRGAEGVGAAALQSGVLTISGLEVAEARAVTFAGATEHAWGDGLVCGTGGAMQIDGLSSHGSARAGVAIAFGCGPSSWRGEIFRSAIGILNDVRLPPGLDFSGLVLHENVVDFASLAIDVPRVDPSL